MMTITRLKNSNYISFEDDYNVPQGMIEWRVEVAGVDFLSGIYSKKDGAYYLLSDIEVANLEEMLSGLILVPLVNLYYFKDIKQQKKHIEALRSQIKYDAEFLLENGTDTFYQALKGAYEINGIKKFPTSSECLSFGL